METFLGILILLSSLGILIAKKPVYAGLSFLLTLLSLSALYLQLSAQFIAVMQILVYAGAILVIFMFVIILFQDAHDQLAQYKPKSAKPLLLAAALSLVGGLLALAPSLPFFAPPLPPPSYGTAASLGKALYLDFFIPFEAVILLFLIALVGAVYIGKKDKSRDPLH